MAIREDILRVLLEHYPDWHKRPYYLLQLILLTDFWSQQEEYGTRFDDLNVSTEGMRLAEVMIREMEVDIFPYKDFQDLRSRCALDVSLKAELEKIKEKMAIDEKLTNLLSDSGVLHAKETLATDLQGVFVAGFVLDRIRPFIDLK